MRTYCTYFDHRYLPRALAMHRSLRAVEAATTHVLCLDQLCLEMLESLQEPGIRPISMEALEAWAPQLPALRSTRSTIEFYFTLTPFLTRYVAEQAVAEGDLVTYLDSDLYFFASPQPIFDELAGSSVGVIGHRFPPELQVRECFGRYNVGFLPFRRDAEGLRCLRWWGEQCAAWCYDRLEDDRFADQKYLDRWPQLFTGVHEITHKGANVAPWNIANYSVTSTDGVVRVDGNDLLFYHFHDLKRIFPFALDSRLRNYAAELVPPVRQLIYAPYVRSLLEIERELGRRLPSAPTAAPLVRHRAGDGLGQRARRAKELVSGAKRGDYIYLLGDRVL